METIELKQENDKVCLAILFSFAVSEFKGSGYTQQESFTLAVYDYGNEIRGISTRKHNGKVQSQKFFFSDKSSCTYQDGHFKFHSPVQSN